MGRESPPRRATTYKTATSERGSRLQKKKRKIPATSEHINAINKPAAAPAPAVAVVDIGRARFRSRPKLVANNDLNVHLVADSAIAPAGFYDSGGDGAATSRRGDKEQNDERKKPKRTAHATSTAFTRTTRVLRIGGGVIATIFIKRRRAITCKHTRALANRIRADRNNGLNPFGAVVRLRRIRPAAARAPRGSLPMNGRRPLALSRPVITRRPRPSRHSSEETKLATEVHLHRPHNIQWL
ncbi:hypothetical protein EVAR_96295_1 [Eumeta japonica]|uniref:Uncharacterized protein n=1 Tax=Eumeta variegata TaxID=151549 RepID=A0A4C1VYX7_EUMVA|nr:hypothetical protein EVAR_96295_1 [Eumeta japonica]